MNNILWKPSEKFIQKTNLYILINTINSKYSLDLKSYHELYDWSIKNIEEFWEVLWEETGIIYSQKYTSVVDDKFKMPGAQWFDDSKLNFAENLLKYKNKNIAIEFYNENLAKKKITYLELYDLVAKVSFFLKKIGLKKGDRVAGLMPNIPETIICMLATSSIGAIWSSCSPDFGVDGILDRFNQIKPKVIISTNGYYFKGKKYDINKKVSSIINSIPSINTIIMIDYIGEIIDDKYITWQQMINNDTTNIDFIQLPFNHPLYIMFSSGTTGKPKSIVHSAGGTLIQHLKELKYHTNVNKGDKIFYYTTCGWMMWNWLVSSLSLGATVVLYEGNPFYPYQDTLLKIMNDNNINYFGTSAKYISHLQSIKCNPKDVGEFKDLKTILSTGSPLTEDLFDFVYDKWKQDVQLCSISGGTDIISCFALGNPMLPVYRGELQCIGLGMSVKSYTDKGRHSFNIKGELVCDKAFPSMPIYFWNDDEGKKYYKAYFKFFNNVWTHGDFILINNYFGVKIYGRSDATLNPGGVRIGTSEIYQVVESLLYIKDSLAIGQSYNDDERIILFVKLKENILFTKDIINEIKNKIKVCCSPRHVPDKIISIKDIPYTINGKKVEIAVKNIIHGEKPRNKSALSNPESLLLYKNIRELRV